MFYFDSCIATIFGMCRGLANSKQASSLKCHYLSKEDDMDEKLRDLADSFTNSKLILSTN